MITTAERGDHRGCACPVHRGLASPNRGDKLELFGGISNMAPGSVFETGFFAIGTRLRVPRNAPNTTTALLRTLEIGQRSTKAARMRFLGILQPQRELTSRQRYGNVVRGPTLPCSNGRNPVFDDTGFSFAL